MFKYFSGESLASLRAEWSPLRDNSSPSTLVLTPFYWKCLKSLTTLGEILSRQDWLDFQFSAKNCYHALLKKKSSAPVLPRTWGLVLGSDFLFNRHISFVRDGFSENYKDDLLWLITLRVVKVRHSLHSWGYIASDRCAKCNLKETIDHCFLNCVRVKRVWHYFSPIFSPLLSSTFVRNCVSVFFFKWVATNQKYVRIARYLVKSILYGIWKFRNKCTFHNGTERSDAIIKYIIHDVKMRIHLDFFRSPLNSFKTASESPLCRLTSGSPVVLFL